MKHDQGFPWVLGWDGNPRIDTWLTTYMGAKTGWPVGAPAQYLRDVGAMLLLSAVARVMRPGCAADQIVVLHGKQGIGKTRALQALFGEHVHTVLSVDVLGSEDARKAASEHWVVEVCEWTPVDLQRGTVKSFISRSTDTFRPHHNAQPETVDRTCVIVGTTNAEISISEVSSRRIFPVACGEINVRAIQDDRHELWAEAVVRYRAHERWWLDGDEFAAARVG